MKGVIAIIDRSRKTSKLIKFLLKIDIALDRPGRLWAPRHYEGLIGHPE